MNICLHTCTSVITILMFLIITHIHFTTRFNIPSTCGCVPCPPPLATRRAQQARAPSPRPRPHTSNASMSNRTTCQCAQVSALERSIRLDER